MTSEERMLTEGMKYALLLAKEALENVVFAEDEIDFPRLQEARLEVERMYRGAPCQPIRMIG